MKIDLANLDLSISDLKCKGGASLSQEINIIALNIQHVIGELSLYRQQNGLDPDEFDNIESVLYNTMTAIDGIL